MLGRQNKNFIIRLLKIGEKPIYHIIVTRKRSKAISRLDRIGSVASKAPYAFVKLDFKKLNQYLLQKEVKIAATVWKVLNLDLSLLRYTQKAIKLENDLKERKTV